MKKMLFILVAVLCMQQVSAQKPNSKFGGVQIGAITYSYRTMPDQSLEAVLNYSVQSGISSVELLSDAVEVYAGRPAASGDAIKQWRTTVPMDKFKEIKKMFNKQGVKIHILNMAVAGWSDDEIDYAFKVCKTLGAKGLAMEISEESGKRLAPFAEKHKSYIIFHNHGQPGNPDFSFDRVLAFGPRLMLNLDVGHYYGATGLNPCDIIKRLNKRIASLHLKDKTGPQDTPKNENQAFGKGGTPIIEILQLIQKEKWPINCDIELEYPIPTGSDDVKEVVKIVEYCRAALVK
jgi:sugar phosphate isomerase/epimerase